MQLTDSHPQKRQDLPWKHRHISGDWLTLQGTIGHPTSMSGPQPRCSGLPRLGGCQCPREATKCSSSHSADGEVPWMLGWNSHRGSVAPQALGGGTQETGVFFSGWKLEVYICFFSHHFNGKSPKCLCSRLYLGRAGRVLRDLWNGEGHEWQELRNTFSFFSFYFSQLRSIELRKFQTTHDQATQKHECFFRKHSKRTSVADFFLVR